MQLGEHVEEAGEMWLESNGVEVAQGEPVNLDQEKLRTSMVSLRHGGAAQRPSQEVALPGTRRHFSPRNMS